MELTKRYKVEDALDWQLYKESLRDGLMDRAANDTNAFETLGKEWFLQSLSIDGDDFVVVLSDQEP